jgi:hypothetical protein
VLLLLTSSMTNPTGALFSRSFELQGKGWQKKSFEAGIYGTSVVGELTVLSSKCMRLTQATFCSILHECLPVQHRNF